MADRELTVAFKFDGVINTGDTEMVNVADIPDPPVEGMRDLLRKLRNAGFGISIYSERAMVLAGRKAVIGWLLKNHMLEFVSEVTGSVPIARCIVDDRAIRFCGKCDVQSLFWRITNNVLQEETDEG